MSLFDPNSFLAQTIEAPLATKSIPLPIGEATAQLLSITVVPGDKNGVPWFRLEAQWEITDPAYLSAWGDGTATAARITQKFLLDVNDGGGIAMGPGKNVRLGRLLEATGANQPGKTINSAVGQIAKIKVGQRPDQTDPETIWNDVEGVVKA